MTTRYMPNSGETYGEYVAEGIKSIRKEVDEQIFWGPTDRGRVLAYRTSILKEKLDNDPFFSNN